jgi:hypothetical protein
VGEVILGAFGPWLSKTRSASGESLWFGMLINSDRGIGVSPLTRRDVSFLGPWVRGSPTATGREALLAGDPAISAGALRGDSY